MVVTTPDYTSLGAEPRGTDGEGGVLSLPHSLTLSLTPSLPHSLTPSHGKGGGGWDAGGDGLFTRDCVHIMASQDSVGGRRLKLLQAAREAHVEVDSLLWRLLRERGRALSAGELQQFLGDNTEALYSVAGEGMLGAPPPPPERVSCV